MKHQLLIYSLSSVLIAPAQFQNTYNSVTGAYTVLGAKSGSPIYMFRDTQAFVMYVDTLRLPKVPTGVAKITSGGLLWPGAVDYLTEVSNKPTIPSAQVQSDYTQVNTGAVDYIKNKPALSTVATTGAYSDLSGKPTIPAQYNPSAGTGISITGTYPNQTITNTGASLPVYDKSAFLSNSGVLIVDTFTISGSTPTVSFSSVLSAAGKSNFKLLSCTGYRAGATAITSPQVSCTALTSNSATFSITQQSTATVTILGINVLSGLPLILVPDPVNVKLILSLIAY